MSSLPLQDSRFVIQTLVSKSAMGDVYKARDTKSGDWVALKRVRGDGSTRIRGLAGREFESLARVKHSGVVRPVGRFENREGTWIATEWIEGRDLGKGLPPFGETATAALLTQCFATLASVHEAGVLHRDVKPSNLILTPKGEVKWIDFGVAFAPGLSTGETMAGTMRYTDPRVLAGSAPDGASDVYGLILTALECHVGKPVWNLMDPLRLYRHVTEVLQNRASELVAGFIPPLGGILLRGLASVVEKGTPYPAVQAARDAQKCFRTLTDALPEERLAKGWVENAFADDAGEHLRLDEWTHSSLENAALKPKDMAKWMAYSEFRSRKGDP